MFFSNSILNILKLERIVLPKLESRFEKEIIATKEIYNLNVSDVTRVMIDTVSYLLEKIRSKLVESE